MTLSNIQYFVNMSDFEPRPAQLLIILFAIHNFENVIFVSVAQVRVYLPFDCLVPYVGNQYTARVNPNAFQTKSGSSCKA